MNASESRESERRRPGDKRLLLKPKVRKDLIEALRVGATHEIACQYAGLDGSTFYRAMALGRDGDKRFVSLVREVEEASSRRAVECLARVRNDDSWQSQAWWLERRYPHAFALRPERFEKAGERPEETPGPEAGAVDLRTADGRQRAVDLLAEMPPAILEAALARHTGVGQAK